MRVPLYCDVCPHVVAQAHTKMGNQDKFLHETAILLLAWMYDIRHVRPHVFHHECASEFEESIMATVLSDYDMATSFVVHSLGRPRWLAHRATGIASSVGVHGRLGSLLAT